VRATSSPAIASESHHADLDARIADAQRAEREGLRDEARAKYEAALASLHDPTQAPLASALCRWIARTYQLDANSDAALDCLDAAVAIAEVCEDDGALGHALNVTAVVRWQQGALDEAETLYRRAYTCGERSGDRRLTAMTSQNLGVIANVRGEFARALQHYETSLGEYRALGLAHDVCVALNNLAMLHTDLGQWIPAATAYDEALAIAERSDDRAARVMVEINRAELWIAQERFSDARAICDRVLALAMELDDPHALGETYKHYGILARETGHYRAAEEHLVRAHDIAESRGDLLLLAEIARERAEVHSRQGRHRDTVGHLNRAHRLFSQLRARHELADIDRRTTRVESSFIEVVRRWGESIESKDIYTQGHCVRVADLAIEVAQNVGMESRRRFWFRVGALLHDVGKIDVPAEVLNKPGKLDDAEWILLRRHPEAGVELLGGIDFPEDVIPTVLSHHEKWDGTGYPHGLAGEAIPFVARILSLADVYDALTTDRSYRKGLAHEVAMGIMRKDVGTHFDPALFEHFEQVMARRHGKIVPAVGLQVAGV
jgi:putative nucleotidyltransferase with HDIG domain